MTSLNNLIYAGPNIFSNKLGISQKKGKETKAGGEMKLEKQIKKLQRGTKIIRKIELGRTQQNETTNEQ